MEKENITGTISLSNGIENADTFGAGVQSAIDTNADREAIIERATTPRKQNWADRVPYVIMPKKKAETNAPVEQKKPLYSVPNIGDGMDFYGMRITQDALNAAYKRANEYKPSKKKPTQTDEDQARFDYGIMAVSMMGGNAKLDGSDLFGNEDGFKDMTWSQKRDRLVQAFNAGGIEYTLPYNIRDAMIISRGIDSQENGLIKAKGLGELYALAQANGYDNQSGTALSRGVSSMFPNRKKEMALAAKPYLAPQIQEKIDDMMNPMVSKIPSPEGVLKLTSAEWDKITEINKQLDIVNQYMKEVREKTAFLYENKIYDLIGKPEKDLLKKVKSGRFASPWLAVERNRPLYDEFMSLPERSRVLIEPLIKIYNKSENTWFHDMTEAVMSPFADIVRAGYSNTIRLFYDDETYQAYMEDMAKFTAFATPEAKDWNLLGEGIITLGNIGGYAATMSNPVGVVATQQAVANRNSLEAAGRGVDVSSWEWILASNAEAAANIAIERLQGKAIFGKASSKIPDRGIINLGKASFSGKGRKHLVKAIAGQMKTIPGEVIQEVVQDSMDTAIVSSADVASRKANGDEDASYMDAVEETAETALDTVTNPGLWMGIAFGSAIAPMTVAARKAIEGKEYRLLSQEDANNLIGSINSLSNEIEGRTIEATKQGVALYGQNTTRINTITQAREIMEANSAIKEYVEADVRKFISEKVVPFRDFIRFLYMDYGVDIASGLLKEGVFKKENIESDEEGVKITGDTAAFAQNLNDLIKTKEFSDVLGIKEIEGDRVISQFVDNELKSGHIMNENGEEYLFTYRDGKPFMVRYEEKEYKPIDPDTTDENLIREIARNAVERNGEDPGDTKKVNDAIKKWKELSRESREAFAKSLRVNGSFVATKEGERAKYSDGTPIVGTITFFKGSEPAEAIHEYSHAVIPNLIEEANNGRDEAKKFLESIVKVYGGEIDKDESGKITNLKIDTEEAFVRDIKRVAERAAETRGASLKYMYAPENVDLSSRIYMHFDSMLDSIFRVAEKYRMHMDSKTFSEATLKFAKSGKIDLNASVQSDVERLKNKRENGESPAEKTEENKEPASATPIETAPTPEPPDDENEETVDSDTTESDTDKSEEQAVPEAGTDTATSSNAGTKTEDTESVQGESEKTEDEQASDSDSSIAEYVERERVTEIVNNVFDEKTGASSKESEQKEQIALSEPLMAIVSKVEDSETGEATNAIADELMGYGKHGKVSDDIRISILDEMAKLLGVEKVVTGTSKAEIRKQVKDAINQIIRNYGRNADLERNADGTRYSISGIYTGSAADYEKPSLHYVGTGEGNQVYGWGLYGSTVRGVAETYASMTAAREVVVVDGKEMRPNEWENHPKGSPEWLALGAVEFGGRNFNKKRIIEEILNSEFYAEFTQEQRNAAIEYLRSHEFGRKKRSENIYEQTFFTDRAPGDESHLLNWYKPVSKKIQLMVINEFKKDSIQDGNQTLDKGGHRILEIDGEPVFEDKTGERFYKELVYDLGSPKAASEFLARAGIDGVKYPVDSYGKPVKDGDDAGWNYVSFRDDNIRVDYKWTDGQKRYSVTAADEFIPPSEDAKKAVGADGVELMTGGKKMYSVSSGARGIGVDYDIDDRGRAYFYHYGDRGRRITDDDPITADEILSSKSSFTSLMKLANGKISKQERTAIASLYADIINKAVEYVGDNENGVAMLNAIWKWAGASVFKSVKANGDAQYSLSIDLTTICKKTEQILNAVSAFQVMNRRGCTPAEMMQIYLQTGKAGFQTPCPCCYVFSHWIRSGLLLQTAWAAQNEFKKDLKTADEFNRLSEEEKAEYEKKWKAILKEEVDFAENNEILIEKAKELLDSSLLLIDRFGSIITGKNYTKEQKDIAKDRIKEISPLVNAAYQIISRSDYAGWIKSNMFDKSGRLLGMQTKESDGKAYDFTPVDPDILFAYNRADELVAKYPAMARFRVSKGSAGGKAVETDADNAFGEVISGLAKRTYNPFETDNEEAQSNAYGSAIAFTARQNLRGGCRIFSWSDNLMKFGPDMFWNFVQLQAVGSGVQSYSKQLEGVELICAMGGYNNGSLIAKGDGYEDCNEGDDGAVLNPVNGKYQRLVFSDVQGINHKELFALNKKYDKSGNILVGMSDEHIALALSDKRIFFVIPWHSSSLRKEFLNLMMDMLGESRASDSQDYTSVQGDGAWKGKDRAITDFWKNECYREKDSNNNVLRSAFRVDVADGALSESQKKYRALRERIILGKATEEDIKTAKKDTFLSAVVRALKNAADGIPKKYRTRYYVNKKNGLLIMNTDDSKSIYPYEYWDENSTYENQDANGERYLEYCRRLGFVPKFCGFTKDGSKLNFGDFHNLHGYPKLLIDRRMYDRSGKYQGVESVRASGMEMRMITKEGLEDTWTREIVDKNGNKVRKSLITVVADKDSAMKIAEDVMKHNASNKVSIKKFKNVNREDIVDAAQKAVDSFGNLGFKTDGSPKSGVDPVEEIVDGLRRSVTIDHSRPMSNAALCAAAIAEDMIRNHGNVYDKEKEHKALVKFLYGTKSDEETQKKYNKAVEKAGKLFNKFKLDSGDKLFERLARESNVLTIKEDIQKIFTNKVDDALDIADGAQKAVNKVLAEIAYNTDEYKVKEIIESSGVDPIALLEELPVEKKDSSKRRGKKETNTDGDANEDLGIKKGKSFEDLTPEEKGKIYEKMLKNIQGIEAVKKAWLEYISANKEDIDKRAKKVKPKSKGTSKTGSKTAEEVVNQDDNYDDTDMVDVDTIPDIKEEYKGFFDSLNSSGLKIENVYQLSEFLRWWVEYRFEHNPDGSLTEDAFEKYRRTMVAVLNYMLKELVSMKTNQSNGLTFNKVYENTQAILKARDAKTVQLLTYRSLRMIQHLRSKAVKSNVIKGLRAFLDVVAPKKQANNALEKDLNRKISALMQFKARYIRAAVVFTPGEIENQIKRLNEIIEKRTAETKRAIGEENGDVSNKNVESRVGVDVEVVRAYIKLAIIDKYGGLYRKSVKDVEDAAEEIKKYFDEEAYAHAKLLEEWNEDNENFKEAVISATEDPSGKRMKPDDTFLRGLVGLSVATIRQRLQFAFREKLKDENTVILIDRICGMFSDGYNKLCKTKRKYKKQFDVILNKSVAGTGKTVRDMLKLLDTKCDFDLNQKLIEKSGQKIRMTWGQVLQLFVSLQQKSSFEDAIKANGREGQDEIIRAHLNNHPELLRLAEGLREAYRERRAELSEEFKKMTGHEINSPDPFYMPVRRYVKNGEGLDSIVSAWDPFGKTFTPRIKSLNDFDLNASIVPLFIQREQESARVIAYGVLGMRLRAIFGSSEVKEAIANSVGDEASNALIEQITDFLSDGFKNPGDNRRVKEVMETLGTVTTYMGLSWNVNSTLKQMTSIFTFVSVIDGGFPKVMKYILDRDRTAVEEFVSSDGFASRYGDTSFKEVFLDAWRDNRSSALKKLYQSGMTMIQIGDYVPSMLVGPGLYKERRDQLINQGVNPNEARAQAARETWEKIEEAQQTSRLDMTLDFMRRQGIVAKNLTKFASSPLLQMSHEVHCVRMALDAYRRGDWQQAKVWRRRAVNTILCNHVIMPALMLMVSELFGMATGGDEPDEDEFIGTLIASMISGPFSRVFALGILADGTGETVARILGYKPKIPDNSQMPVNRTIKNAARLLEAIGTGLTDHDWSSLETDFLDVVSQAFRPAAYARTIVNNAADYDPKAERAKRKRAIAKARKEEDDGSEE